MKKAAAIAALVIGALALVAGVAQAGKAPGVPTTIPKFSGTIDGVQGKLETGGAAGFASKCLKRKVAIRKIEKSGKRTIALPKTNKNGHFSVDFMAGGTPGRYIAVARQKNKSKVTCLRGKSDVLKISRPG
jgi:hypothetical protein